MLESFMFKAYLQRQAINYIRIDYKNLILDKTNYFKNFINIVGFHTFIIMLNQNNLIVNWNSNIEARGYFYIIIIINFINSCAFTLINFNLTIMLEFLLSYHLSNKNFVINFANLILNLSLEKNKAAQELKKNMQFGRISHRTIIITVFHTY